MNMRRHLFFNILFGCISFTRKGRKKNALLSVFKFDIPLNQFIKLEHIYVHNTIGFSLLGHMSITKKLFKT